MLATVVYLARSYWASRLPLFTVRIVLTSAADEKIFEQHASSTYCPRLICQNIRIPLILDMGRRGGESRRGDPASPELTWSTLTLACYRIFQVSSEA
jgi:hypothetical protein